MNRTVPLKKQFIIMRVKVYYQKEIHIVQLKEYTLEELKRCVRAVFMKRVPREFEVKTESGQVDDKCLREMARGERKMEKFQVKESGEDSMMQSFMSEESEWQFASEINDSTIQHASYVSESIKQDNEVKPEVENRLIEEIVYPSIEVLQEEENKVANSDILDRQKNQYELPKKKQAEAIILNEDIQCDGCFSFPIVGTIYKCLACPNYDLCSKCEPHTHIHHPFLKVTHPHHYPIKTDIVFSRRSFESMTEQQKQNKKAEAETLALLKKEAEMQSCDKWEVPLSELKSRKVCSPNFLTSIVNSLQ